MNRYGIRMRLPPGDPMRAPHLLGDAWEASSWYEDAETRDRAFERLQREDIYSRRGDIQSLVLAKTER